MPFEEIPDTATRYFEGLSVDDVIARNDSHIEFTEYFQKRVDLLFSALDFRSPTLHKKLYDKGILKDEDDLLVFFHAWEKSSVSAQSKTIIISPYLRFEEKPEGEKLYVIYAWNEMLDNNCTYFHVDVEFSAFVKLEEELLGSADSEELSELLVRSRDSENFQKGLDRNLSLLLLDELMNTPVGKIPTETIFEFTSFRSVYDKKDLTTRVLEGVDASLEGNSPENCFLVFSIERTHWIKIEGKVLLSDFLKRVNNK